MSIRTQASCEAQAPAGVNHNTDTTLACPTVILLVIPGIRFFFFICNIVPLFMVINQMFCEFMEKFRRLVLIALGRFYEEREENRIFLSRLFAKDSQNIHTCTTLEVPTIYVRISKRETEGKTLGYSISQTTLKK